MSRDTELRELLLGTSLECQERPPQGPVVQTQQVKMHRIDTSLNDIANDCLPPSRSVAGGGAGDVPGGSGSFVANSGTHIPLPDSRGRAELVLAAVDGMPERQALASELRHVIQACTASFNAQPRATGMESAVRNVDCRRAMHALCSPRDSRLDVFPLEERLHARGHTVRKFALVAWLFSSWLIIIWLFSYATMVEVEMPSYGDCGIACHNTTGQCSYCGGKNFCRAMYDPAHNATSRTTYTETNGTAHAGVNTYRCFAKATQWAPCFIVGTLIFMLYVFLCTFSCCHIADSIFVEVANSPKDKNFRARIESSCLGRWLLRKAPDDCVPDALPLYCNDPNRIGFGPMAVFSPDAVANGETPCDTGSSLVTLPMFLCRCMTLFVPRATVRGWRVNFGCGRVSPDDGQMADIRMAWEYMHSFEGGGARYADQTISVSTFAKLATRCNCNYDATIIESFAACLGIPSDMAFGDFVVLQMCLLMCSSGSERSLGHVRVSCTRTSLCMSTLSELCAVEYAKYVNGDQTCSDGDEHIDVDMDRFCSIIFGPRMMPWLAPRHKFIYSTLQCEPGLLCVDWATRLTAWEHSVDSWRDAVAEKMPSFFNREGIPAPISLAHLLVATSQLLFQAEGNHCGIAYVYTAQAFFEIVAGNLDCVADPRELLQLLLGSGFQHIPDDMRTEALIMMQGPISSRRVELDCAICEVEDHMLRTGRFDLAAIALDSARMIHCQLQQSDSVHAVDFRSWLQFAIDIGVRVDFPEVRILERGTIEMCLQHIRQHMQMLERGSEASRADATAKIVRVVKYLFCGFVPILPPKGTSLALRDKLTNACWGTLAGIVTSALPLFWACLSWNVAGTLPMYVAVGPLLLTLPAYCVDHFESVVFDRPTSIVTDNRAKLCRVKSTFVSHGIPHLQTLQLDEIFDAVVASVKQSRLRNLDKHVWCRSEMGAFFFGLLVLILVLGGFMYVVFVSAVVPHYVDDNVTTLTFMSLWVLVAQVVAVCRAVAVGLEFQDRATVAMSALDRTVTGSSPIIDLRRPENVVQWLRLCSFVQAGLRGLYIRVKSVTTFTIAWATMGAIGSLVMTLERAAFTPFRAVCGWFGLVGCAFSLIQLVSLASVDRAVTRRAEMLSRLHKDMELQIAIAESDQLPSAPSRVDSIALRSAASCILTELRSYEKNPVQHFYFLFGFRVGAVLQSMGSIIVGQGLVYLWNAMVRTMSS